MRVDFLGLEAFLSVAECGSFTQAAAQLNLSQSALSHRVRKLEGHLGLKLVVRTTRQMRLTPEGEELLPGVRRLVADVSGTLERLRRQGRARQAHEQSELVIGCMPTIAYLHMPAVLRAFAERYPQLNVRVQDRAPALVHELVLSGAAEFAVTSQSVTHPGLQFETFAIDPILVICPADHELAGRTALNWSEIARFPLITLSREAGDRVLIENALTARRVALEFRYEAQHAHTVASMAAAGMGLAVLPSLAIDARLVSGTVLIPVRHPAVARKLAVVTKHNSALSPAAQALRQLIVHQLRKQIPLAARPRRAATSRTPPRKRAGGAAADRLARASTEL